MTASELINYLKPIPGVAGSFLCQDTGEITAKNVLQVYDDAILAEVANQCRNLLSTFANDFENNREARIDFSRMTVFARQMESSLLVILIDKEDEIRPIRVAANLVADRYQGEEEQESPADIVPELVEEEVVEEEPLEKEPVRYQIEETIGEGGTATVYKAYDTRFRRHVALKRFRDRGENENNLDSDFESEVEAISQVSHPHVIRAYDLAEDSEGHFIIMELIEGQDLEQHLLQSGALDYEGVRALATQLLEALIAVHHSELLHLDIKPSNVMVTTSPSEKLRYTLVDFGRACTAEREEKRRLTESKSSLHGSLYHMSPEQLLKSPLDGRSDLYSLGVLLYESLCGQRPFEGDDTIQVMSAHLMNRVTPIGEVVPELPEAFADWIMSLIVYKPARRPESAQEALESLLELSTVRLVPKRVVVDHVEEFQAEAVPELVVHAS